MVIFPPSRPDVLVSITSRAGPFEDAAAAQSWIADKKARAAVICTAFLILRIAELVSDFPAFLQRHRLQMFLQLISDGVIRHENGY